MIKPIPLLKISICIAVFFISIFYILLSTAGNGTIALPEPDSPTYLQYARNMAEGHPYVYAQGEQPSSGSTTHLYIFLLALLYKLGATGSAFLVATFIFNACCYIGIICLVWLITKKMKPSALPIAMGLILLSGHTINATLKMTDIGFFSLLTIATFAALIYQRYRTVALLSALCAITRPEGFIFAIAFGLCGISKILINTNGVKQKNSESYWYLIYSFIGGIGFLTTLLINYLTTGYAEFMSVANKGFFNSSPFSGAILLTLNALLSTVKGVFWGLNDLNRQFYFFPLLAGCVGLLGIILYPRKQRQHVQPELWLALATIGTLVLTSTSSFAGLSFDRYLGWIIPFWIIYISIGFTELSKYIKARYFKIILGSLLLGYQPISMVFILTTTYIRAADNHQTRLFIDKINHTFPAYTHFGNLGGTTMQFFAPTQRFSSLYGITSSEYFYKHTEGSIEHMIDHLKHRPDLRFDYWMVPTLTTRQSWVAPFIGKLVLQDQERVFESKTSLTIYEADWSPLASCKPIAPPEGMRLKDWVDIGYPPHEKQHDYRQYMRLKNYKIPTIAFTQTFTDGTKASEAGRLILGSESFRLSNIDTNKSLTIILRTSKQAHGYVSHGKTSSQFNDLRFNQTLQLSLHIDGEKVPIPELSLNETGFSEVSITIPSQHIHHPKPLIQINGDHTAYAYWAYQ